MRVLLDTNVLIAANVSRSGLCSQVFDLCIVNHSLVSSSALAEEFREKLVGKFRMSPAAADETVGLYFSWMETVEPQPLSGPVCRDPDDDVVLATALAGGCRTIITGDADLLELDGYAGLRIVNPRTFMSLPPGE